MRYNIFICNSYIIYFLLFTEKINNLANIITVILDIVNDFICSKLYNYILFILLKIYQIL